METKRLSALVLLLMMASCGSGHQDSSSVQEVPDESQALRTLIDRYISWLAKEDLMAFEPADVADSDTAYQKMDAGVLMLNLKKIKESRLFDKAFISQYNSIWKNMDERLRSGKLIYYTGELPPWGNDSSPWCNCQDLPERGEIQASEVVIRDNKAQFKLDALDFSITAIKSQGEWKIESLQGFDELEKELK